MGNAVLIVFAAHAEAGMVLCVDGNRIDNGVKYIEEKNRTTDKWKI